MLQLLQALSQEWADEVALQHRPGCKNAYQIFSTFGVGIAGRDRSPPASKGSGGRGGKPSPIRFWVGIGSRSKRERHLPFAARFGGNIGPRINSPDTSPKILAGYGSM
jgi:hypothetical protein